MGANKMPKERMDQIKKMILDGHKIREIKDVIHCSERTIVNARQELREAGYSLDVIHTSNGQASKRVQIPSYLWDRWDRRTARIRRYYEQARKANA